MGLAEMRRPGRHKASEADQEERWRQEEGEEVRRKGSKEVRRQGPELWNRASRAPRSLGISRGLYSRNGCVDSCCSANQYTVERGVLSVTPSSCGRSWS